MTLLSTPANIMLYLLNISTLINNTNTVYEMDGKNNISSPVSDTSEIHETFPIYNFSSQTEPYNANITETRSQDINHNCIAFLKTKITWIFMIILLGLIGNSMTFLILSFRGKKNTMNMLLRVLAVVDNLYLLVAALVFILQLVDPQRNKFKLERVKIGMVMRMIQLLSVWMIVLIGVVRYMAICRPFYAKYICTQKRATATICALVIIDIIIHIPQFFIHDPSNPENIWKNDYVKIIYFAMFYKITCFFLLPFCILAFLNSRLLITFRNLNVDVPQTFSTAQKNHRQELKDITKVVVAIITVYMISYLPSIYIGVLQILYTIDRNMLNTLLSRKNCPSRWMMEIVIIPLQYLNSSVNFLIYFFFRKSFRDMFKGMIYERINSSRRRSSSENSVRTQSTVIQGLVARNSNGPLSPMAEKNGSPEGEIFNIYPA